MKVLDWLAGVLLIIGGLNWGVVGLFSFNLISLVFGDMTAIARIIYVLVGISALYSIYRSFMRIIGDKEH